MNKLKALMLLFLVSGAIAEPVVIRDYGGVDSGLPDLELLKKRAQENPIHPPIVNDSDRYPVMSSLTPGYLEKPQTLREPVKGAQPFFVIGDDVFSRDWLEKNKPYLIKLGAQGLATNISTNNKFVQLEMLADPLPLVAVPMDEIASILHFNVYPVLVTGEEIAQ